MKDNKLLKNLYYFLSLICYVVAILFFTKSNSTGFGILWFIFGSACLNFANAANKKSKDEK